MTTIDPARLARDVEELAPVLRDVSMKLHENPEVRFQERRAAAWLADAVEQAGVHVERGVAGLPTAFHARVGEGAAPRVAILAEYDALPEVGHACGHNLIAAGALGAFLSLARQRDALHGAVDLFGTPAEEGGGGKITLLEAGAFDGVDAALMFHPADRDVLVHATLANAWMVMTFHGAPSHAAAAPWDGRSALTACMSTFHLIDAQRVHLHDGVRVHGYVTNGGQAVNIIPELASAEFSLRARDKVELERVRAVLERCARGAATACGVTVELTLRTGYAAMVNNLALARRFGRHLGALGRCPVEADPTFGTASTDMGDVSMAVPAIHPWIQICDKGAATLHQRAFAEHSAGDRGHEAMLAAAKAMALTTADVLEDASFRAEVRREFDALRSSCF